jgi:transcriptional regulator with XRE-family HTH domain
MDATSTRPLHLRLADARRRKGLRQRDVGAVCELARETISRVETGDVRYCTPRVLLLIATFLEVEATTKELREAGQP